LPVGGHEAALQPLLEAKALDDTLDDVKAITQVVGYAANDGIVWCILTNGIKWGCIEAWKNAPHRRN